MKKLLSKIIKRFRYEHLRNETHVEFHTLFKALVARFGAEALGIERLYVVYEPLTKEEEEALDLIIKSDITAEIDRLDHERDGLYRGLDDHVKADLHHFDLEKRRSAAKIAGILDHYGNIAHKGLDDETAAIEDLHRELLKQENFVHVAALGLGDWLGQLVQTSRNLEALLLARIDEAGRRPAVRMQSARREVDEIFRKILNLLEALVHVNGEDTNKEFITDLNLLMERYKDLLAQEAGRRHPVKDLGKADHCVVEPIDVQKYTEKAITPIPKAYWREEGKPTVELVFAKDFYVTYKNNVNVGTADLTLHGKGDYKGRFDVKFNIAR
jgi:hypothetical protein